MLSDAISNSILVYFYFLHKVSKNVSVSDSEGLGLVSDTKSNVSVSSRGNLGRSRLGLVSDQKSNVSVSDPNVSFTSLHKGNQELFRPSQADTKATREQQKKRKLSS